MKVSPLLALLPMSACHVVEPDPPCADDPSCTPSGELVEVMTVTPNLDLLFVIDDSPSMAEKQSSFRAAFPTLLDKLTAIEGGPNLHVGVISTDMGTSSIGDEPGPPIGAVGAGGCAGDGKAGRLQRGGVALPPDQPFLVQSRDGRQNFAGTLASAFGELSALGSTGCGFEQPLAATAAAVSGREAANAGFVRPSANLAVIVLSDEDDCSAEQASLFGPDSTALGGLTSFRCFRFGVICDEATDTLGAKTNCRPASSPHVASSDAFADALLATKPDPRRVMFGAVVGTTEPVAVGMRVVNGTSQPAVEAACRFSSSDGTEASADPAIRLTAFADHFERSNVASICAGDLAPAAATLGDSIAAMMTDTCLPPELAEDACLVEDRRDADPAYAATLAPCRASADGASCFDFVADASCATGRRLTIERAAAIGDEWATLRCRR